MSYSTKKPMNTGFTGYFFTFLSVEPAGISTLLEPSAITGISEADAPMVPMMVPPELSTQKPSAPYLPKVTI